MRCHGNSSIFVLALKIEAVISVKWWFIPVLHGAVTQKLCIREEL